VLYVDACHAGVIGSIRGANHINYVILSTVGEQNEVRFLV